MYAHPLALLSETVFLVCIWSIDDMHVCCDCISGCFDVFRVSGIRRAEVKRNFCVRESVCRRDTLLRPFRGSLSGRQVAILPPSRRPHRAPPPTGGARGSCSVLPSTLAGSVRVGVSTTSAWLRAVPRKADTQPDGLSHAPRSLPPPPPAARRPPCPPHPVAGFRGFLQAVD